MKQVAFFTINVLSTALIIVDFLLGKNLKLTSRLTKELQERSKDFRPVKFIKEFPR